MKLGAPGKSVTAASGCAAVARRTATAEMTTAAATPGAEITGTQKASAVTTRTAEEARAAATEASDPCPCRILPDSPSLLGADAIGT